DTLKRHMVVHKSAASPTDDAVVRKHRPRAAKACFLCAQSKLRCEGENPCRRCQERGLHCRFPQQSRLDSSTHKKLLSSTNPVHPTTATSDIVVFSGSTNHESQSTCITPQDYIEDNYTLLDLVENMDHAKQQAGPMHISTGPTIENENIMCEPSPFELQNSISTSFLAEVSCTDFSDHFNPDDGLGYSWDAFNLDVFNFGTLETEAIFEAPSNTDNVSETNEGLSLSENAYKQSFLLWTPTEGETWLAKTADLSPTLDGELSACVSSNPQQHALVRLEPSTRYRILSSILSIAGSANHQRILSSFPSLEVLEYLLSRELAEHSQEADSWLHIPSFDPNTACTELVLGLVIAGAFRTDRAIFLKFALALHELHQHLISRLFYNDGRNVRLLEPIQCFVLMIQGGLWSGNSRRIEICEALFNMPINMMRRGGSLRVLDPEGVSPHPSDSDLVLKEKWHAWIDYESRKRLALHLLILSTQYSMAFLTYPPLTHTEIHTSLPAARALWNAPSAEAWRAAYLSLGPPALLTLHTCIEDPNSLSALGNSVDTKYTTLAVLCGLWLNTWQYKEYLKARDVTPGATQTKRALSTQALYQEARESLESFAAIHTRWLGPMDPSLSVLHERQLMYLDVSLEDLQLLGGKDGEREARRVLPRLKEWAQSRSCRQAMWHAGQILREARRTGDPTLRISTVIAIYHASLILWSYSIIPTAHLSNNSIDLDSQWQNRGLEPSSRETEIVLDGDHTPLVQQFCVLGFGKPCITRVVEGTNGVQYSAIEVIHQPEVMLVFRDVLYEKCTHGYQDCPSLVDNLIRLIGQLGQAAEVVQRRQTQRA
ncbi:uncharacterized protein SETTUDRAFT_94626, partial [Exserohilum turcica Et28A]